MLRPALVLALAVFASPAAAQLAEVGATPTGALASVCPLFTTKPAG